MSISDPTTTLENVCQHLLRSGVDPEMACELIDQTGRTLRLSTQQFLDLAARAEQRRPSLCKQRCHQRPCCPYCDACLGIIHDWLTKMEAQISMIERMLQERSPLPD